MVTSRRGGNHATSLACVERAGADDDRLCGLGMSAQASGGSPLALGDRIRLSYLAELGVNCTVASIRNDFVRCEPEIPTDRFSPLVQRDEWLNLRTLHPDNGAVLSGFLSSRSKDLPRCLPDPPASSLGLVALDDFPLDDLQLERGPDSSLSNFTSESCRNSTSNRFQHGVR